MVAAAASWGFGTVASKLSLDRTHLRPLSQQSIQLVASVVVLGVVAATRGCRPSRVEWRQGRVGLLEPGASYILSLLGLSMTAATHASLIGALEPAFVTVAAWLFLRERVPAVTAVLMAVTLIGAALVVGGGADAHRSSTSGDLLLVASVVCAAAYVTMTISSRASGSSAPLTLTFVQQVWALGLVAPVLGASMLVGGFGPLPQGPAWLLVVVSGLLSYLVPFALYLAALESLPAALAAPYLALIPLCGLIGAAAVLHEPLTGQAVAGGTIVIVALVVMSRRAECSPLSRRGEHSLARGSISPARRPCARSR